MMIVAMWCRHLGDNLIGIGKNIPWNVPSDTKCFLDVVNGQTVVCGRATFECFENRSVGESKMIVMSANPDYEVCEPEKQFVVTSQKKLADMDLEEDLYVAGGAKIYELFLSGKESLKPHIIVDCVYDGAIDDINGERIDINNSVAIMEKKYRRITPFYVKDNVKRAIWIKKGEFVEQSVLKRLIMILEQEAELA